MTRVFRVADLFCGAGGSSTGAEKAIRAIGGAMDLVAVNHWPLAIETHQKNHPSARHYIEDLNVADPERIVPEGYLDLLMASPQCTFYSRARGGKPVTDQQRMDPWAVQRWLSKLAVRCLLVENVPEFVDWGPLLSNGKPDPKRKGDYFRAWMAAIWMLGYDAQWRCLNAADYGDATTRVRFFLQARKDGKSIRWPEATHSSSGLADMFGHRPRWRAAREVIEWERKGASLFGRKVPLSPKTRLRIARGLKRFGGPLAPLYIRLLDLPEEELARFNGSGNGAYSPFVTAHRANNVPKSADDPVQTITTIPGIYLYEATAEPFIFANRNNAAPRGDGQPVPTITTAHGGGLCVVEPQAEPFVLGQQSGATPRHTSEPLPTIATDGAIALIDPHLIKYYKNDGGGQSIEAPVPAITTNGHFALCQPLAVPYGPKAEARPVEQPLPTILTKDRLGLAEPMIVPYYGEKNGLARIPRSPEEPLATITTEPRFALCVPETRPFIVPQFGEAPGQSPRVHAIDQPLPAVTSHGAGALVEPAILDPVRAHPAEIDPRRLVVIDGVLHILDIRFRMLTNVELARAMSFDDEEISYEFVGNKRDVTKQIGNAVPVRTAAALVRAILEEAR